MLSDDDDEDADATASIAPEEGDQAPVPDESWDENDEAIRKQAREGTEYVARYLITAHFCWLFNYGAVNSGTFVAGVMV